MKSVISANLLGRETCGVLCGFLHGLSDVHGPRAAAKMAAFRQMQKGFQIA